MPFLIMNEIKILLYIYAPIVIFIIAIIVIAQIKNTNNQQVSINLFGFSEISLPIKNSYLNKLVLFITSIFLVVFYYISLDFGKFYPNNFKVAVYFDTHGINTLLNELEITELNGLKIDKNYTTGRLNYFANGDTTINNQLDYENYYSDAILYNKFTLDTDGKITLLFKKISGIHNYQIIEGTGELTHKKYLSKTSDTQIFVSKFNKIASQNDKISIKFKCLFNKLIISPEFNQYLIINGKEESIFDHSLFAVTALYPLPYPDYSNTLYLYQHKNLLIPIGYAVHYSK